MSNPLKILSTTTKLGYPNLVNHHKVGIPSFPSVSPPFKGKHTKGGAAMSRGTEHYYEVLADLKENAAHLYPGKVVFNKTECSTISGIPRATIYCNPKRYNFARSRITLSEFARMIS